MNFNIKKIQEMKLPNIEIVLSTLNEGLFGICFDENFKYLIIHQVTDTNFSSYDSFVENSLPDNVRYLRSATVGLSKSRNIGIKNSLADYIWIMDDDVEILTSAKGELVKLLESDDADIYILGHKTAKANNKIQNEKYLNCIEVASVCSIDMLIKKSSIDEVLFDENFGLGAKYPSGEEYIFCNDMLAKGKRIKKTTLITSYHPRISSGNDFFTNPIKLVAKRKMFMRAVGNYRGYLLYIAFLLKKLPIIVRNKAALNLIKSFFMG